LERVGFDDEIVVVVVVVVAQESSGFSFLPRNIP
jgi:hypothetical protein